MQRANSIQKLRDDSTPQCVAILLAGGLGTRFGASTPKQLALIADKSILSHTLESLSRSESITHIVVVANPSWKEEIELDVRRASVSTPLTVVDGGSSRNESVKNGVNALPAGSASENILVHDGVRPLFTNDLVARVLHRLETACAVVPVIPSADPLFEVSNGEVTQVVSRKEVLRGQSPQGFKRSVLVPLLNSLSVSRLSENSTLYELIQRHRPEANIGTVEGEFENIKVTQPVDQAIVSSILQRNTAEWPNAIQTI